MIEKYIKDKSLHACRNMQSIVVKRSSRRKINALVIVGLFLLSAVPATFAQMSVSPAESAVVSATPKNFGGSATNDRQISSNIVAAAGSSSSKLTTQAAPHLATELSAAASNYTFAYNANYSDTTHHQQKDNNYNFTVPIIDSTSYTSVDMQIKAQTDTNGFTVENGADAASQLDTAMYFQGTTLSDINICNVSISQFYTKLFIVTAAAAVLNGEIWSAKNRTSDGKLVPDAKLGSSQYSTSTSGSFVNETAIFQFSSPVSISALNTYNNGTDAYIFFAVYYSSGSTLWNIYSNTAGVDDGTSYNHTASDVPPASDDDWGAPESLDYYVEYNYSLVYYPRVIDMVVASPITASGTLINADGTFTDTTTHFTDTQYRVQYNSSKTPGYIPLISINYTANRYLEQEVTAKYSTNPDSADVNWTLYFDSSFTRTDNNVTKYFTLPSNYTVNKVYYNSVLQSTPANYVVGSLNGNLTVGMKVGGGNYTLIATTSNLLNAAILITYANAIANDTGVMGVLYPSAVGGDIVQSTVTNVATLGLDGGSYNASLRSEDGTIYGNASVGAYIDQYLSTTVSNYSSTMTFQTQLDPDQATGVWTFQFRWHNGTQAGATYITFNVIPVTDLSLVSPLDPVTVVEGETLDIQVSTLDKTHNSSWADPGTVQWDYDSITMTLDGLAVDGIHYSYSTSINTSIALSYYAVGAYTFNISFTDAPYTTYVEFTMNFYHRGATNANSTSSVEAGSTVPIEFLPLNATGGNSVVNSSSVMFDFAYSYNASYAPGTGKYSISVAWSNSFVLGLNYLVLNWTNSNFHSSNASIWISYSVGFTVVDSGLPIFNSIPTDNTISEGDLGTSVVWNASDYYPDNYSVYISQSDSANHSVVTNTTLLGSGPWFSQTNISIALDFFITAGFYNITIVVQDTASNKVLDTMFLTVVDTTPPEIDSVPSDGSVDEADVVQWVFTDLHANYYEIYVDTELTVNSSWITSQPIVFPVSNLTLDVVHNIKIVAFDMAGNSIQHTVLTTVSDFVAPTFVQAPSNISYSEGSTGNALTWNTTDNHPTYFEVYVDNAKFGLNIFWTNEDNSSIPIDNLGFGIHNITILVHDSYGNIAVYTVYANVADTTNPSISGDSSVIVSEGQSSILKWTASDVHQSTYAIYSNGIEVSSGVWTTDPSFDTVNLAYGTYNLTVVVVDKSGNFATFTTFVTVQDVTDPIITSSSVDYRYFEGDTGNTLYWIAEDLHAGTYTLYQNSSEFSSGMWNNSTPISINIDGLGIGIYNFTVFIFDTSGNSIIDTVIITVKDPSITETTTPDIVLTDTVYEGTLEQINGTWYTLNGTAINGANIEAILTAVDVNGTESGSVVRTFSVTSAANGSYLLNFNYTGLLIGKYQWRMTFSKALHENVTLAISINLIPHILFIKISTLSTLVQNEPFAVSVTVYYNDTDLSSQGLGLSSLTQRTGKAVGINVSVFISVLLSDGISNILTRYALTSESGVATVLLSAQETQVITKVQGITVQIANPNYSNIVVNMSPQSLPGIQTQSPSIIGLIVQTFVENTVYLLILAVIIIIIIAAIIVFIRLRNKQRKLAAQLQKSSAYAVAEITGLLNINMIFLKNTTIGVPVFEKIYKNMNVEPELISGLGSAISGFLSEIEHEQKYGIEQMKKSGLSITSHHAAVSSLVVVSTEPLPDVIIDQIIQGHLAVEGRFTNELLDITEMSNIPESEIFSELNAANLKLDLLDGFLINSQLLSHVEQKASIPRTTRKNMQILKKYPKTTEVTLSDLYEFLIENLHSNDLAAKVIIFGYTYGIITSDKQF